MTAKESLKELIEVNFEEFNNLDDSEVIECELKEFDFGEVDYLKEYYRFDYKGICVYFVEEANQIWIEKMLVEEPLN
jgi:hypothetical protein